MWLGTTEQLHLNWMESQWKLKQDNIITTLQWKYGHCRTKAGVTIRDPSKEVNLIKVVGSRKVITKITWSISFIRVGYPTLMIDITVFKDKFIGQRHDRENLANVWSTRIKDHLQSRGWISTENKRNMAQNWVKPYT